MSSEPPTDDPQTLAAWEAALHPHLPDAGENWRPLDPAIVEEMERATAAFAAAMDAGAGEDGPPLRDGNGA